MIVRPSFWAFFLAPAGAASSSGAWRLRSARAPAPQIVGNSNPPAAECSKCVADGSGYRTRARLNPRRDGDVHKLASLPKHGQPFRLPAGINPRHVGAVLECFEIPLHSTRVTTPQKLSETRDSFAHGLGKFSECSAGSTITLSRRWTGARLGTLSTAAPQDWKGS